MRELTVETKYGKAVIRLKIETVDDWRGWVTEIENPHSGKFLESTYNDLKGAAHDQRWMSRNPIYVTHQIEFAREMKVGK